MYMILEKVFGVTNDDLATHVSRQEIDDCFNKAIRQKRQIIVYGSSKQGKTTLLNAHIKQEDRIVVQCSPTTDLQDIYKTILKKLDVTIQSSSNESSDDIKTKFNFKIKIPMFAKAEVKVEKSADKLETISELQIDLNNAQDIAEIMKKYFPDKIVVLENFHCLEEKEQKLFAFDLRTFQDIDVRVIIWGIWRERNRLVQYNGELQDRVAELSVEPWTKEHLKEIIRLGEKSLNIDMSDIENELIKESFGNVGMLQELCKECCYDAQVIESGKIKKLTNDNLQNAITKITSSYASRFHKSLETFADVKPRQSQDGSNGLGMPYFFVQVILTNFDIQQIENGLSIYDLRDEIKKIHPDHDNQQFDRALTVFLNRINKYQKNHGITPSIFDWDTNLQRLSIVDPDFIFFIRHCDHDEFLKGLKVPLDFTRDSPSS